MEKKNTELLSRKQYELSKMYVELKLELDNSL